jgi:hypothetical protein
LLSRYLPWLDSEIKGKEGLELMLQQAEVSLDGFINSIFTKLSLSPSPSPANLEVFNDWRKSHLELEMAVRATNYEYVIVRSPPIVMNVRAGAKVN